MYSIIFLLSLIGVISSDSNQQNQQVRITNFLEYGTINQCEGKDASNYTFIYPYHLDQFCVEFVRADPKKLIATSSTGEKSLIALQGLASSDYPAGAFGSYEVLLLGLSGTLEGKYIFLKEHLYPHETWLKKCSSVLGYSYTFQNIVLLIADKLDMNIFLNPGGAFEAMKKISSTICYGSSFTV